MNLLEYESVKMIIFVGYIIIIIICVIIKGCDE